MVSKEQAWRGFRRYQENALEVVLTWLPTVSGGKICGDGGSRGGRVTEPTRQLEAGITDEERSILAEIDHIREHIETPEEAARVARAVEFDQIRAVVQQLEAVAVAAKAVERDLAQELATTNRLSASTARLIRDQLATTLRALAEAGWLGVAARRGSTRARARLSTLCTGSCGEPTATCGNDGGAPDRRRVGTADTVARSAFARPLSARYESDCARFVSEAKRLARVRATARTSPDRTSRLPRPSRS